MKHIIVAIAAVLLVLVSPAAHAAPPAPRPPVIPTTHAVPPDQFDAQHDAAVVKNPAGVTVQLQLAGDQKAFHPGERIDIQMSITGPENQYKADYDRLERIEFFTRDDVYYEQRDGVADPAPDYYSKHGFGGAYTGPGPKISPLSAKPLDATGALNQWLRFSKAGEYRIYLATERVSVWDDKPPGPFGFMIDRQANPLRVASNVLTIDITAPDAAWQATTIADAAGALMASKNTPWTTDPPDVVAANTLRYIGTPEAIDILIDNLGKLKLWDDINSWVFVNSRYGLYEAQDRKAAYAGIERCIANPDFPVRGGFLAAAAMLKSLIDGPDAAPFFKGEYDRLLKETADHVQAKTGAARAATLYTLLSESEYAKARHETGASDDATRYSSEIVERTEDMPPDEMKSLLMPRMGMWADLSKQNIAPVLRALIASPATWNDVRSEAADRLREIDPSAGRAAILADMVKLQPTMNIVALESLPDDTLPGVDEKLAANLLLNSGYESGSIIATLIARYGTGAILPQVKAYASPNWGRWDCKTQDGLLAYLLRTDPEYGKAAFETCLASRANTGCYKYLYTGVGAMYSGSVLEGDALAALSDPSADVEADAANYLRMHGSEHTQKPLLAALAAHNKAVTLPPDYDNVGSAIVLAIIENPAVLYTHDELVAMESLCTTKSEKQELQTAELQATSAPQIEESESGWQVAQYMEMTFMQAEQVAAQFPKGTAMTISSQGFALPDFAAKAAELREYLAARGITATVQGG